ncbi:hypothetical protein HHX47_DHR2000755 [Lentinula edodes]|nr:hypothetical protein HHX47_DHR2000755 [Lentinula edodes]
MTCSFHNLHALIFHVSDPRSSKRLVVLRFSRSTIIANFTELLWPLLCIGFILSGSMFIPGLTSCINIVGSKYYCNYKTFNLESPCFS